MKLPSTTTWLIVGLTLLALGLGYNYMAKPFSYLSEMVEKAAPSATPSPSSTAVTAEAILAAMTPEQKVAQLLAVPLQLTNMSPPQPSSGSARKVFTVETVVAFQPGLVTLFGDPISLEAAGSAIEQLDNGIQVGGLSPLIAVDHEGGMVQRLSGKNFTDLPSWNALCAMEGPERQTLLEASASELQDLGIDVVLGPVVDLASRSAILKTRTCSHRRSIVSQRSSEFITIFNRYGILSVLKHFPGIGSISVDLHHRSGSVLLAADDVLVFKDLLDQFPSLGLMTTHAALDAQFDGTPCSLSKECVANFQAEYPNILIFADGLDMVAAGYLTESQQQPLTLTQRSQAAILAGNDILLFGPTVTQAELELMKQELVAAYELTSDLRRRVDESALKVLRYKQTHANN